MQFALVTPTYAPDFARARLLVESVNRFAEPGLPHYLVVDRRDVPLFAPLEGERVRLLVVEDVLPRWVFRVPGVTRWWLSLRSWPVRNWVLQQIVKLSVADHVSADALIFIDSDVTFVRPFGAARFVDAAGRVRLSRVGFQSPMHRRWLGVAAGLLGVPEAEVPAVNYVGNLITWRADVARQLHAHLAARHRRPWQATIARQWHFSEYMLYGLFVERVLGIEASGHFADTRPVLQLSWDYDLRQPAEVDRLFADVGPEHIGVMIHSKDGVPVAAYRPHLERLWSAHG